MAFQKCWRGRQARKLAAQIHAAIRIQTLYRALTARKELTALKRCAAAHKAAAVIIQAHWKQHRVRVSFARQKNAALVIESHARGWLVRRQVQKEKKAATIIQVSLKLIEALQCFISFQHGGFAFGNRLRHLWVFHLLCSNFLVVPEQHKGV